MNQIGCRGHGADRSPLVAIPGLGGDASLFAPLARYLDLRVAPWLPVREDESLADYARRLSRLPMMQDQPLLVGVSMGGMIALEVARLVPVRGIVLVSSCQDGSGIAPMLRLGGRVPSRGRRFATRLARVIPSSIWYRSSLRLAWTRAWAARMAARTDPATAAWAVAAILSWPGVSPRNCPVLHLHGDEDRLIPLDRLPAPPDIVIRGGGHLMVLPRARQIAAGIDRWQRRRLPIPRPQGPSADAAPVAGLPMPVSACAR